MVTIEFDINDLIKRGDFIDLSIIVRYYNNIHSINNIMELYPLSNSNILLYKEIINNSDITILRKIFQSIDIKNYNEYYDLIYLMVKRNFLELNYLILNNILENNFLESKILSDIVKYSYYDKEIIELCFKSLDIDNLNNDLIDSIILYSSDFEYTIKITKKYNEFLTQDNIYNILESIMINYNHGGIKLLEYIKLLDNDKFNLLLSSIIFDSLK